MELVLFFLAVFISVVVFIFLLGEKRSKKMIAQGVIKQRDLEFVKNAESFLLRKTSFDRVAQGVKKLPLTDLKAKAEVRRDAMSVVFTSPDWKARLYRLDDEGARSHYRFNFTAWRNSHNIPLRVEEMNMLLTGVEKIFVDIDPKTEIRVVPLQFEDVEYDKEGKIKRSGKEQQKEDSTQE